VSIDHDRTLFTAFSARTVDKCVIYIRPRFKFCTPSSSLHAYILPLSALLFVAEMDDDCTCCDGTGITPQKGTILAALFIYIGGYQVTTGL
jgi:hypothetical protein